MTMIDPEKEPSDNEQFLPENKQCRSVLPLATEIAGRKCRPKKRLQGLQSFVMPGIDAIFPKIREAAQIVKFVYELARTRREFIPGANRRGILGGVDDVTLVSLN